MKNDFSVPRVTGNFTARTLTLLLGSAIALAPATRAEDPTMMMSGGSAPAMTGSTDATMMSGSADPTMMMSGGSDANMMSGAPVAEPDKATAAAAKVFGPPEPAKAEVAPLTYHFVTDSTRMPLGELRMIPVERSGGHLDQRLQAEAKVEGGGEIEILRQPEFLPGQTMGFMRVRSQKAGTAKLTLGDKSLDIEVRPETSATRRKLERPVITAPANGSAVKGEFTVGMETFSDEIEKIGGKEFAMRLRLPGGKMLEPREELGVVDGPVRRATFLVNADELPDGRVELTPVMVNAATNTEFTGDRVVVRPLAADAQVIAAGECEDFDESWTRPKDWREFPGVGVDSQASAQRYVRAPGNRPIWGIPVNFPEEGAYQLFMSVRGEMAGGAYPTLAVKLEKGGERKATTRMVSGTWHRLPIGPPFRVKKGENALGIEYTNDFGFQNRLNRDAAFDTYELVKVKYRGEPDKGAKPADLPLPTSEQVRNAPATPTYLEPTGNDVPMRVTFTHRVDGLGIKGVTEFQAAVWRNNRQDNQKDDKKKHAEVFLYINGELVDRQRDDNAKFQVPTHKFVKGKNEVRLYSRLGWNREAWSEIETVYRNDGPDTLTEPREMDRDHSWTYRDGGWNRLDEGATPGEADVLTQFSTGATEVALPDELRGPADIIVKLKGDVFNGEPEAELTLNNKVITTWKAGSEWKEFKAEKVELPEGEGRKLSINFTNDAYEGEGKDRNLYIGAVTLRTRSLEPDKTAPTVKVLYPKPGQQVSQADAVVLDVFDDRAIENIDLVLDGKSLEYWVQPGQRPGPVVLPLALRTFNPGEHKLVATIRDKSNNEGRSEEIKIVLAEDNRLAARLQRPYDRAVRLLKRFGFGPEPRQLAEVLTHGEEAWLKSRLVADRDLTNDEYRAIQYTSIRLNKVDEYQVKNRALLYAMHTDNPVAARFNFWIQNHFCTWQNKSGSQEKWDEYTAFQQAGIAPFFDLLYTSATSSAMMVFLDQKDSYAGKINENYAREIMELHTVGVKGGYSQDDITQLANMLTGWSAQKEGVTATGTGEGSNFFRYSPYLNDGKAREIYGLSLPAVKPEGRFDRVRQYLEMLASRPQTAHYYAGKLAAHYYGPNAPEALVDRLAKVYLRTGGETGEMLLELFRSPEFWSETLPDKIAQPLDYGIGLERVSGGDNHDSLHQMMQKAGRALFDRSTPDGYPEEDDEYADSNYMLQKWRFAKTLEWELTRDTPWSYWQPKALEAEEGQRRLVDMVALRLTGGYLSDRSQEAALRVLKSDIPDARQKFNQVAVLIAQLPETQVR